MTLTYKGLNCAESPVYLSRALQWKTSTRQLRSSDRQLVVPLTRRPQACWGHRVWNDLSKLIELHATSSGFKRDLKTFLYSLSILGTRTHGCVSIYLNLCVKRIETILYVALYKNVKYNNNDNNNSLIGPCNIVAPVVSASFASALLFLLFSKFSCLLQHCFSFVTNLPCPSTNASPVANGPKWCHLQTAWY